MFHKITYNPNFERLCIYNSICNFKCKICSYKLMDKCYNYIDNEKVKNVIEEMAKKSLIKRVHFLGGEPTINPWFEELLKFCKDLNLYTCLGHTNGSKVVDVDEANVSIKAYTEDIHIECTGVSNKKLLRNFMEAYEKGIKLKANSVFIPDFIDYEEIEKIAKFIEYR